MKNGRIEISEAEIISIEKDSKQVKSSFDTSGINDTVVPPYDLKTLADFYEGNTWNMRCCNIKAQVTSGLGYVLEPTKENPSQKQFDRLSALLERPNPNLEETIFDILFRMMVDYEAVGNGYLEIARNRLGEISEIYHVPAYTVRKAAKKSGYWQIWNENTVYFNRFGDRKNYEYGKNEIVQLKSYYLKSSFYGMPEFLPALAAAILDKYATNFNINFFDNSAIPALAIIVKGGYLSEPVKRVIKEFLTAHVKGINNTHRTLYIPIEDKEVEIKFEKLMEPIKDYSFRNMRMDNRDEIIAAHGVPPRLVGVMTAGQLGGSTEAYAQLKMFKEITIAPRKRKLETVLNRMFQEGLGITDWQIKLNELDVTQASEDADYVTKLHEQGIIDTDEARSELGYEPRQNYNTNLKKVLKEIRELRKSLEE